MPEDNQDIKEIDGETIFIRQKGPDSGDPKFLLYICHGLGEHIGWYDEMFEMFPKQYCAFIFGNDHVGHGKSSGVRGEIHSYDKLMNISIKCIEHVCEQFKQQPKLFILGHSMV